MDKYYLGKGKISGEPHTTAHTLSGFSGTLEQAAETLAAMNPGIEDFELTENGDSERGMIELPKPPVVDRDFAKALMSPPRTVKAVAPKPGTPRMPFNVVAGGVPREALPQEEFDKLTGKK